MLRQHIIASGAEGFAIAHALCHRVKSGLRLQIFKTIAGDENGLAGFVHPVVGPANTLQQTRRTLRCAHLDHAVDIAPVDT